MTRGDAEAARLRELFVAVLAAVEREQESLDRLDAVAGDGDHGATMVIGCRAVVAATHGSEARDSAELLRDAGAAFADVGGSIGPLWGTALLRAGRALDDGDRPLEERVAVALAAAVAGIAERGASAEGDKTMLDVLGPASRALTAKVSAGEDVVTALRGVAEVADRASAATAGLRPSRGRAARGADRSVGSQDPGAASAALILATASRFAAGDRSSQR